MIWKTWAVAFIDLQENGYRFGSFNKCGITLEGTPNKNPSQPHICEERDAYYAWKTPLSFKRHPLA